ncbi:hypothetical protein BC826DRAFT_920194, partial [Russula brevipes]
IQDIINRIWFKTSPKSKADAVTLRDAYQNFPLVGIALVMNVIECCLDEWSSGNYVPIKFYEAEYKKGFENILNVLKTFAEETKAHGIVPKLQRDIFLSGW